MRLFLPTLFSHRLIALPYQLFITRTSILASNLRCTRIFVHQPRGSNHPTADVGSDLALSSGIWHLALDIWHPSLLLLLLLHTTSLPLLQPTRDGTRRDGTRSRDDSSLRPDGHHSASLPSCLPANPACLPARRVLRLLGCPGPRPVLLRIQDSDYFVLVPKWPGRNLRPRLFPEPCHFCRHKSSPLAHIPPFPRGRNLTQRRQWISTATLPQGSGRTHTV